MLMNKMRERKREIFTFGIGNVERYCVMSTSSSWSMVPLSGPPHCPCTIPMSPCITPDSPFAGNNDDKNKKKNNNNNYNNNLIIMQQYYQGNEQTDKD